MYGRRLALRWIQPVKRPMFWNEIPWFSRNFIRKGVREIGIGKKADPSIKIGCQADKKRHGNKNKHPFFDLHKAAKLFQPQINAKEKEGLRNHIDVIQIQID